MYSKSTLRAILLSVVFLLAVSTSSYAKTLERAEDAIARLFPRATFKEATILLSAEERQAAGDLLGRPVEQALVSYFQIQTENGRSVSAYLDAHRVRTLPETLMLSVAQDGTIVSVDVLAFREPQDYMPRRAWYAQFSAKKFNPKLQLNRDIQGITGATLTGRATVKATRKMLCVHKVLQRRKPNASP
ncbi:MAG: FMN-binding protein [Kiritimatiellae bacterium]|nr:FMN-binding protein [Kiritimatiellia bacterium]